MNPEQAFLINPIFIIMAVEKLNPDQEIKITIICDLLTQASTLLGWLDEEIQSVGSTGPNPINHVEYDLKNTVEYIKSWIDNGVDL